MNNNIPSLLTTKVVEMEEEISILKGAQPAEKALTAEEKERCMQQVREFLAAPKDKDKDKDKKDSTDRKKDEQAETSSAAFALLPVRNYVRSAFCFDLLKQTVCCWCCVV